MISPNKSIKHNHFCTLDIETSPDGEVLSICIYNGEKCIHFKDWFEWFEFISINNKNKLYRKFVAHNGGKFDWVSMVECLIDDLKDVDIIVNGSRIIVIKIKDLKYNILLYDSLLVLLKGLKGLCKTFDVPTPKKDIDIKNIEWIFNNDYNQYKEYLEADCISLYQIMEKTMELFDIDFWPITLPSLSLYKFRTDFLKDNLFSPTLRKGKKDDFFKESYAGGRVECFRSGVHDNVWVYDVNSLYPYVMSFADIPIGLPFKSKNYNVKACGFYKIQFNQTNRRVPAVLWKKDNNGLEFVYEGSGIYYNKEINLLKQIGGDIEFDYGYVFPKTKKIFKSFIEHYYKLRKDNEGNVLDYLCKILMNSLYGKFAQKRHTKKLIKLDYEGFLKIKDKLKWSIYDEDKGLYEVTEERDVRHRAVHISSIITSLARITLYKYFLLYPGNLIYCDTDSVHLTCPLPEKFLDNKKLGFMKLENENERGCYIGRKQYVIGDKMKFKGIPLKSNLDHDNLSFEDYVYLFNNGKINFEYSTFPALKTVLNRNKKACKIMKLNRNIKKGDYLTNYKKG